jgi:hypothetical protein
MTFAERHLREAREIIDAIDIALIERAVSILVQVRDALKIRQPQWEGTR